jgi:hypothetical protein
VAPTLKCSQCRIKPSNPWSYPNALFCAALRCCCVIHCATVPHFEAQMTMEGCGTGKISAERGMHDHLMFTILRGTTFSIYRSWTKAQCCLE